jgi:hypothetical protein
VDGLRPDLVLTIALGLAPAPIARRKKG